MLDNIITLKSQQLWIPSFGLHKGQLSIVLEGGGTQGTLILTTENFANDWFRKSRIYSFICCLWPTNLQWILIIQRSQIGPISNKLKKMKIQVMNPGKGLVGRRDIRDHKDRIIRLCYIWYYQIKINF